MNTSKPQSFPVLPGNSLVPLAAVLCTEELHRRPPRPPDYETENRALVGLAQALADSPRTILQTLAEKILVALWAGSAGVSLLTEDEQRFVWPAIAGAWQPHIGGGTPRDFGPCGDVLDANAPRLFKRPERRYDYFLATSPAVEEALLAPFYIEGKAVGTIWAIAHDDRRTFDAEDLRQLESLGRFASAAYQVTKSLDTAFEQRRAEHSLMEEAVRSSQATETLNAELRASEEALHESEERFRAAIGIVSSLIWTNNAQGLMEGDQPGWSNFTGQTFEEYQGYGWAKAVHPEDAPLTVAAWERAVAEKKLFEFEHRLRRRDGAWRLCFIRAVPLLRDDGTISEWVGVHTDITERKQAEETLRESEAFNRSIIDSSPDCIKVLDLHGHLLAMLNGQALLGIDDIRPYLGTSWIEFWDGEDRLAARAAVATAAAGEEARFVGFFRTLGGEPKWWDVTISPILAADGKPARLLAISRDVTERKRAEMNLALLASVSQDLARLTSVDEMMQTVGAEIGAHLQLSLCAFAEIDETAEEAVITHDWHRDDVPGLVGVYRLADFVEEGFIRAARAEEVLIVRDTATDPRTSHEKFATLKIASFVCVPLIRDGQWRFALCLYHSTAYDWQEDEIELARELTARIWTRLERLRIEDALYRSQERYRYLFNSIDEGFCVIDMMFDEHEKAVDYRFLEVNPSFEQQTGMHDATGKRMREFFPDFEASWFQRYGDVALTGEPVRFANESKELNRWFDVYAFRIGGPDSRKVAVIFNNITDRTKAEHALRASAVALADLDRRKDEFLAMLSHELRNPLAPISNAVQLLRLQTNEGPLQQQARTIIERQVGQLNHLVDDLLEVSRITTGRVQLRRDRIVVSGIVERAVETARPLVEQRRHELTVSLPPHPIWLHADAARMEQVVVNLLTNAAKYTDEAGRIWLTVEQEGDAAVLRVRDTGTGIAPELLPRIFDLFTQAERSLDRSQGGLGIGLCLVQRLVDLHGGTVEVYSVLGHGSEFVVRLPVMLTALPPSTPRSTDMARPPGTGCRVLVVDDNKDAAAMLTMLLEASGHDVRMAHDGPAALKATIDDRPDVVLLDIGLPGLDGFEVAKRIRQQPTLEHIVLVALTGYGQESDRARSREAGFDHHLVKPADFDKVRDILATVSEKAT